MGNSSAKRIQYSFLRNIEKRTLDRIVAKIPDNVTSDCLTWIGFAGAIICAIGYGLSNYNINWLWLSSGGLVINWFGDSLDGTLARYRNTQRKIYGFFIDHSLDAFTITIMCIGAGISPLFSLNITLLVLVGYLILSIFTYLGTILKDEFQLSYGGFGPTEFRFIIIIINTIAIYLPLRYWGIQIHDLQVNIFNFIGLLVIIILFSLNISKFIVDLKYYAVKDPLPQHKKRRI